MEKVFLYLAGSLIALMFLHTVMQSFPDVPWHDYLPAALCSKIDCGPAERDAVRTLPSFPS